jgi:dienelactone hydrolase
MRITLALTFCMTVAAHAAPPPDTLLQLPGGTGIARLAEPDRPAPGRPVVIIIPDVDGADGRADSYTDTFIARGIAVLELGYGPDLDWLTDAAAPGAREAVVAAIEALVSQGREAARIGLLGFGMGGRIALAYGEEQPAVALYPRCVALRTPAAARALIVQGARDQAGCAALPPRSGLSLHIVPDAGHGWDVPGAYGTTLGVLLVDPAGGPRLRGGPDLRAMAEVAAVAADWLEEHWRARLTALLPPKQVGH